MENEYQADTTTLWAAVGQNGDTRKPVFGLIVENPRFFESGILPFSNRNAPIAKKNEIRGNKMYIDLGFSGIYSTPTSDFPRFFEMVVKYVVLILEVS